MRPGFVPSPEEETIIDDIVARLDGLPLAIELAAARLHTMGVDEVAAGLDRRFRLLATGPRHVARHRSLAAAVTWSFDLLDTALRDVLLDVSVFAGAFTAEDAAAVAGIDAMAARDALDTLTERSLVTRAPNGRFVLLETLRAFGADRLELAGRAATVSERHARHEVAWIEAADRRMRAPSGGDVIAEIDAALPELRAALTWCLTHDDAELAGRLAVALGDYGQFRLRPDVLAWADEVLAHDPADTSSLAAELWATSAMRAWIVGDLGETAARLDRALAVTARHGARHARLVLDMLGALAMFEGQLATALTWLRRAGAVAEDDAGVVAGRGWAAGADAVVCRRPVRLERRRAGARASRWRDHAAQRLRLVRGGGGGDGRRRGPRPGPARPRPRDRRRHGRHVHHRAGRHHRRVDRSP